MLSMKPPHNLNFHYILFKRETGLKSGYYYVPKLYSGNWYLWPFLCSTVTIILQLLAKLPNQPQHLEQWLWLKTLGSLMKELVQESCTCLWYIISDPCDFSFLLKLEEETITWIRMYLVSVSFRQDVQAGMCLIQGGEDWGLFTNF